MTVDGLRACECGAMPVAVSMPGHESMVALECPSCGMSTGYTYDRDVAYQRWQDGFVAQFTDALVELDDEPVQMTLSEEVALWRAEMESLPERLAAGFDACTRVLGDIAKAMGGADG